MVRNAQAPNVALLIAAIRNAKVQNAVIQSVATRNAVIHVAVPIAVAPSVALLSVAARTWVRNAVTRAVVPNVVFQCAALQIEEFPVVIRVALISALIVALISAPYAARNVVAPPASRVRDDSHEDSRAAVPWMS